MLIRHTSAFFTVILLLLCSACNVGVGGKPSTSAPNTENLGDYLRACDEKREAIRDWESNQMRKIEDEWIEGERGILQSAAKGERIQEEATAMQNELRENCERNKPDLGIASKDLGIPGCVDADVIRDIEAEFEANQDKTKEKYVGQRLCVRGEVIGISEGTMQGTASVLVRRKRLFDTEFQIKYMIRNGQRESRATSLRQGRVIEAECTVRDVWDPVIMSFEDCDLRNN